MGLFDFFRRYHRERMEREADALREEAQRKYIERFDVNPLRPMNYQGGERRRIHDHDYRQPAAFPVAVETSYDGSVSSEQPNGVTNPPEPSPATEPSPAPGGAEA